TSLGLVLMNYDWDLAAAGEAFARALALAPNSATARHWSAHHLLAEARYEEAEAEAERALGLDPPDLILSPHMAWHMVRGRDDERGGEEGRRTLELFPSSGRTLVWSGLAQSLLGRHEDAVRSLESVVETMPGDNFEAVSTWGLVGVRAGRREAGRRALAL